MTKISTTASAAPTTGSVTMDGIGTAAPPLAGGEPRESICRSAQETFELGERLGESLRGGEILLLYGGLGAGKTLLAKGVLNALSFDIDEVTSPSFTLVNLYKTIGFDVYHIDLWRLEAAPNPAEAVGLSDILEIENAVTIIEWADRLGDVSFPNKTISITIENDGDEPRKISIQYGKAGAAIE